MRIRALAVVAAMVVIALGPVKPSVAASVDPSAAVAYIDDATAYVTAILGSRTAIRRAADRFVASVRTGCPNLVPTDDARVAKVADALELEADDELVLRLLGPIRSRAVAFSAAVARLPWDNARIRADTADEAREAAKLAAITRPPSLCRDIITARADRFATIPRDTKRFLAELGPVLAIARSVPSQTQFLSSLTADLTPAQSGALTQLERLAGDEERAIDAISSQADTDLRTVLGAAAYP